MLNKLLLNFERKNLNCYRCEQAAKLAELYREQCIEAENELARVREETDVHKFVFVLVNNNYIYYIQCKRTC